MTNTALLEKYIEDSGYKKSFIANQIGITPYALAMKINNKSEFKGNEMTIISKLLKIDAETRDAIFFAV
jgi:hypothetical protein